MAQVIIAVLVPTCLAAAGAVISIYRQPGERLTSGIQHFAAGLVMAAVAVELVPEMMEALTPPRSPASWPALPRCSA